MSDNLHFALPYVHTIIDFLHRYLISTWYYKAEVYEVPGLLTAVLITYDRQTDDLVEINTNVDYETFIKRMAIVKPDWAFFDKENFEGLAKQPHKLMGGWEGRTIYFARGGSNSEFWTPDGAGKEATNLILSSAALQGPNLANEAKNLERTVPHGRDNFKAYEDFIRICINYLYNDSLGEAKAQVRTEPGNEGLEIRDLISQNQAQEGFFLDLKHKFSVSEVLFEVKNKEEISREDLRQLYCYLKPAIGLWGFLVCRKPQPVHITTYNRTLFQNFVQMRGILIITDDDIRKMIDMKIRERNPSEHLHELYSHFIRSL